MDGLFNPELIKQLLIQLGLGPQVENFLNGALGSNALGLSWLYSDPTKSLAYNKAMQMRSAQMQGMFGSALSTSANTAKEVLVANTLRLIGKTEDQVKADMSVNTPLTSLVNQFLVMPKVMQSYNSMANALYNERRYYDPGFNGFAYGAPGRTETTYNNYRALGTSLINSVINSAVHGGMAGMTVEDSGSVAAAYIRSGRLTAGVGVPGDKDRDARIKKVQAELNDYAASINQLRDVIDGPLEQVLKDFEKLTGSSMMSMSRGRVASIASAIQSAMTAGISKQELAGATLLQYKMISPLGGSMELANAMGNVNVLGLNQSHDNGASQGVVAAAQSRFSARTMMSGQYRKAGAAYVSWLGGREDTLENRQAFVEAMTQGGKQSFNQGVADHLSSTGLANNATFMQSALVSSAQNDSFFIAQVNADKVVGRFNTAREALSSKYGLTPAQLEILRSTYDPRQIQLKLQQNFVDTNPQLSKTEAAARASAITLDLQNQARLITGEGDPLAALRVIEGYQGSVEAMRKAQDQTLWNQTRGQIIAGGKDNWLERTLKTLGTDTGAMTYARLLGGLMGQDQGAIAELLKGGKIDQAKFEQMFGSANIETFEGLAKMGNLGSKILFAGPTAGSSRAAAFADIQNIVKAVNKGALTMADIEAKSKNLALTEDMKYALYIKANKTGAKDREITEGEIADFRTQRQKVAETWGNAFDAQTAAELETTNFLDDASKKAFLDERAKTKEDYISRKALLRHNVKTALTAFRAAHNGSDEKAEEDTDVVQALQQLEVDQKDYRKVLDEIGRPSNLNEFVEQIARFLSRLVTKFGA